MSPRGSGLASDETKASGWEKKLDRLGRPFWRASYTIAGVKVKAEIQFDIDRSRLLYGVIFPAYEPTEWEDVRDPATGLVERRPKSGILPFPAERLHGTHPGPAEEACRKVDEMIRERIAELRWKRAGSLR